MIRMRISTAVMSAFLCLTVVWASAVPASAAPASKPFVSAGVDSPLHGATGDETVGKTAHVTSDAHASKVTSSDSAGRVTATITQPGEAVPPIDLPPESLAAAGGRVDQGGQEKLTTNTPETTIQTRALDDGMQTIIVFDNAKAVNEVPFQLDVTSGLTPQLRPTGAIDYLNREGVAVAGVAAPWAVDANGHNLPTHFTLSGNTLTQHVEFNEQTAFPVIADPRWWQMAISTAAGAAVGAAVVAGVPGVGPTVGGIVGGCVAGALNAMWDGADFWGGFWGCASYAALGAVAGMVGGIVRNVLGSRGIGV